MSSQPAGSGSRAGRHLRRPRGLRSPSATRGLTQLRPWQRALHSKCRPPAGFSGLTRRASRHSLGGTRAIFFLHGLQGHRHVVSLGRSEGSRVSALLPRTDPVPGYVEGVSSCHANVINAGRIRKRIGAGRVERSQKFRRHLWEIPPPKEINDMSNLKIQGAKFESGALSSPACSPPDCF